MVEEDHLLKQWPNAAPFEKVIAQLNKDFGEEVFEASLAREENALSALLIAVKNVVDVLLEKNMNKLLRWCYRIDIPQERFDVILKPENTGDVSREIAELILLREAQKIALRETWSQKRTIDGSSSYSS
ncbi:MAG: hypothetical protein P8N19_04190 [Flavobacteriales bacterium]|nr:hypothetical protein [Flavobacteriales bacterium]MDG1767372.1 hypothetical protein [Flavobacteriales bacterium]